MKFTVVTVCYNAAKELEQTMLSVLEQTYPDVEYIVIDGGSTDGSVDIIRKYADRLAYWVSEPDHGIYDAMNKGIQVATGQYLNFMNAGDRFASPTVLAQVAAAIHGTPGLVYGDYYYMRDTGLQLIHPLSVKDMWHRCLTCHQATFFANKGEMIMYDLSLRIAGDFNLMCKIHYDYGWLMQYVDFPICIYSGGGMSEHNNKGLKENLEVAKRYVPRMKCVPYFMWTNNYDRFAHWIHVKFGDTVFKAIAKVKNRIIGKRR